MCVWRSPDRRAGCHRPMWWETGSQTGSACDYADPHWNTVAAHAAGLIVTLQSPANKARSRSPVTVGLAAATTHSLREHRVIGAPARAAWRVARKRSSRTVQAHRLPIQTVDAQDSSSLFSCSLGCRGRNTTKQVPSQRNRPQLICLRVSICSFPQ